MFKTAVVAAAFVASATAETFYWNKNNNFETASNWDIAPVVSANGKSVKFPGSVKIPDASDCSIGNNWASKVGRVMKVATDIEMSTLTLPTNGKIILGDDITMTISEAKKSDTETAWACKPAHATNFKCGDNWNVGGFDEAEPAHMVPCIDDTIVFPDDSKAIQVHIPIATFVSEVQVANPSGKTATFVGDTLTSDGAFNNQDDVKVYTDGTEGQFLGSMILTDKKGFPVGFEKASCTNDCGKHFAGKTANATVKICPGDPMGETTCSESEKVTITDDEWQRQMMFKAVEAQLAIANKHADKMKGFADIGKMVNNKVDKVKSKLLSLPYPMGRVTAGNVALPSVAFKNGTAAPYTSNDWGEALTTLLEGVLDGESAKGIKNVVCQPAGKGGKLSCSGFAGIKLPQGKQAALLASMAKAIEVFFAQMDFDTVPLVIPEISTKEKDVAETIAFSYADADFGMSPFGGANFLKANEAEHIEASLTIGEATKTFDNFDASPKEDQTKFIEYISAMVEATSASPLEVNGLNFGTPPIQVDKSGRRVRRAKIAGHTFSPAQFRMDVKLRIKGGLLLFDPASVAGPMAVGLWGANSLFLKAASLNKLADAFSSTTTTTTRVTKAPGAVTIAEADKVKADEAVAKSFDELVADLPMIKGMLAVENKTVQKAAAELEQKKAEKDVKCQDHTSSACKSAKEALNTAYATYDAAVADLAKTVQKLEVYQAEFDKKKVVDDAAKASAEAERDDATNAKINAANAKASAAAGKVAAKKAEVEAKETAQKDAEENIARIEKEILEKKCAEKDTETLEECADLAKEKTKFETSLSAVLAELATLKAELKKAEAEKASADAAASKTSAEADKKEEDGGMPIAVIAGGAAAVVVIILLVVVILMSGGSKSDGKADANRNVVAFENPMYDDPNANQAYGGAGGAATYDAGGATYGEAAAPDADPGLYDEPAFQANDKSNPMYSSKDNVAEGNGYLDVQPDDDDDDDEDDDDEDDESEEEESEDDE